MYIPIHLYKFCFSLLHIFIKSKISPKIWDLTVLYYIWNQRLVMWYIRIYCHRSILLDQWAVCRSHDTQWWCCRYHTSRFRLIQRFLVSYVAELTLEPYGCLNKQFEVSTTGLIQLNEEVMNKCGPWLGHTLRNPGKSISRKSSQGNLQGNRNIGRP